MTKFTKMKRKQKTVFYESKNLSDTCSSILFTIFVFGVCLLMFSYADNVSSHVRNRFLNITPKITSRVDDFTVKQYTWRCQDEKCVKSLAHDAEMVSLNTCNMLCSLPPIWPKPRNVTVSNKTASVIDNRNISFDLSGQGPAKIMLQNATDLFVKNLEVLKSGNQSISNGNRLYISITLQLDNVTRLKLNTDEGYDLSVRKNAETVFVQISARNYFGARHALETLSQLIWYDNELRILHDIDITDAPEFPYRGLMVDTARNYFPLHLLKKVVDGMSMAKLNVLHLHLTDAVSFPVVLPKIKELAEYGAYGPDMVYTSENIKDLLQYARIRGVRLVLEIDAPSHVNAGWNYAKDLFEEDYVICGENDVFNGHLNPDNPNVLAALENIYSDLLTLSEDDEIFHIGADEVNLTCWANTAAARNSLNLKEFWASYTNQILDRLKKANHGKYPDHIVMWSSPLTGSNYLQSINGNITLQFWLGNPESALSKGHSIIYSTVGHWYLDCGFGPWKPDMDHGVCDPYTPWQTFYRYRPWRFYGHRELALGGEVCLWTEQVDVDSLETRIWPRSAAFAERVWSDPVAFDDYDVYTRLVSFRGRLASRGIKAAAMWPRWCSQNPGKC